jgi:hypothetical protein
MRNIALQILVLILAVTIPLASFATNSSYLVKVSPKVCKHGLHEQPSRNFSVFVFCDDAQGSNIGVILTRAGVGPVEGQPPYKWGTSRRFWQSGPWVTDVTSFSWSQTGRFLYVATSPIYGDGGLFELNLIRQEWKQLIPDTLELSNGKQFKSGNYTVIEDIDIDKNTITVGIYAVSTTERHRIATKFIKMK